MSTSTNLWGSNEHPPVLVSRYVAGFLDAGMAHRYEPGTLMSKSKQKGTTAETAVKRYLNENGYPKVERRALHGTSDKGDLAGVPDFAVEVKNCKAMSLAAWVEEAKVEAYNAQEPYGVVWHKRVGKGSPADWYVTMDGETFTRILKALHQ